MTHDAEKVDLVAWAMYPKDIRGNYEKREDWPEYQRMARAALERLSAMPPQGVSVPAPLLEVTFAIQYNPNCPSPWLIRTIGTGGYVDCKPYSPYTEPENHTKDKLSFGKTLGEAALLALITKEAP